MIETQESQQKRPRGLHQRGGMWHINKQVRGSRIYKSLGTSNEALAIKRYYEEIDRWTGAEASKAWAVQVKELQDNERSWLHKTLQRLHIRGKNTGRGCTLTVGEMATLVLETDGRCMVTGIPFSDEVPKGHRVAPWQMSVDRIDSKRGYHFDNCRIVCLSVNLAMSAWGEDVMIRIAESMLLRHLQERVNAGPIRAK